MLRISSNSVLPFKETHRWCFRANVFSCFSLFPNFEIFFCHRLDFFFLLLGRSAVFLYYGRIIRGLFSGFWKPEKWRAEGRRRHTVQLTMPLSSSGCLSSRRSLLLPSEANPLIPVTFAYTSRVVDTESAVTLTGNVRLTISHAEKCLVLTLGTSRGSS